MLRILIVDDELLARRIDESMRKALGSEICRIDICMADDKEAAWELLSEGLYGYDLVLVNLGRSRSEILENLQRCRELYRNYFSINFVFYGALTVIPVELYSVPHLYVANLPVKTEDILEARDAIATHLLRQKTCITSKLMIVWGAKRVFISKSEILYIKKVRGGVEIFTDGGCYAHRCRLEDLIRQEGFPFLRISCSLAVNACRIRQLDGFKLELCDGQKFCVSKAYIKPVKAFFDGVFDGTIDDCQGRRRVLLPAFDN